MAGRDLLASAGADGTVRIWDPVTAECVMTIPVHHEAMAAAHMAGMLAIGLNAGALVIDLSRHHEIGQRVSSPSSGALISPRPVDDVRTLARPMPNICANSGMFSIGAQLVTST